MTNKKRILIVDDEPSITQLLRLNLEKTGHYAVRAENVADRALDALQEFNPDLILLDVMMPEMDGGQLAEKIQATRAFKHVPIVFLTAAVKQEEVDARDGMIGGFPYIAKPLNVRGVINVIEKNLLITTDS
ncbi:MAG: response regulator [Verrucomicrobiota bacterium]